MASIMHPISADAFDGFQLDSGVVLKNYDVSKPTTIADDDIITATSGGVEISCVPTFTDYGEDVDNCPANTLELKRITGYECKMTFTALEMTEETFKLALGAATVDSSSNKVTPSFNLSTTDFSDIWWVGPRADGKVVAVKLMNALCTGGMTVTTSKDSKGTMSVEMTGHASIESPDTVPMEIYVLGE